MGVELVLGTVLALLHYQLPRLNIDFELQFLRDPQRLRLDLQGRAGWGDVVILAVRGLRGPARESPACVAGRPLASPALASQVVPSDFNL